MAQDGWMGSLKDGGAANRRHDGMGWRVMMYVRREGDWNGLSFSNGREFPIIEVSPGV